MARPLARLGVCLLLVLAVRAARAAERDHEEAVHQKPYVHRIRLMDENGDPITADSTRPYSPRRTCRKCHDYGTISKGMHFDMGARKLSDDFGKPMKKPWVLSHGMVGGYLPTFRRQYARKKNKSAAEIDLTAFEFVRACGPCHPGGGALERDRDGQRYDLRQKENQGLAKSLDGDYHKAQWHKTGVVEIDCLFCHAQWDYSVEERTLQLRAYNYRYAATAAAGFGLIKGKALAEGGDAELAPAEPGAEPSDEPAVTVQYDKRLFDAQGYVTLDIAMPKDRACLSCHQFPAREGIQGRDRRHWSDVHTAQGMRCVDCHSGGLDHNFALGLQPPAGSQPAGGNDKAAPAPAEGPPKAAPTMKGAAAKPRRKYVPLPGARAEDSPHLAPMTCKACHQRGLLGASRPAHVGLPRLHLERIACVTCHVGPALGHRSDAAVYTDAAPFTPEAADLKVPYPDQQNRWQIWYRRKGGQIRVQNCQTPCWWGNRMQGDDFDEAEALWPYFEREMAAAWKIAAPRITDDDGDGTPEINTRDEMRSMDAALKQVLKGSRFKAVRPVYIKGDSAHWVGEEKVKVKEGHPDTEPLCVSLGHVVLGPQQALGAGGCTDCHARDQYFFDGERLVTYLTYYGFPRGRSMRRVLGYPSRGVRYGALREGTLKPYGLLLIPLAVVLCLLHYVLFGPKRVRGDNPDDEVPRFGLYERVVHLVQTLAFLVLAVTGVGFIVSARLGARVPAVWASPRIASLHMLVGGVFILTAILSIVRWVPAAIFRDHDVQWFKVAGGYLWLKGEAPAGKFDAGQKVLFWLAALLCILLGATGLILWLDPPATHGYLAMAYFLHDLAALLLIPVIIGHVYLRTICNPGTLRSIFAGTVTRAWARHHHPIWADELEGKESAGRAAPDTQENAQ